MQLPEGVPANVPRFSTNGLQYETINTLASGWQTLTNGFRVYVERLCYNTTNQSGQTKNELDYRQIVFINKQGAYQSLWFLKMMNKSQSATGETYLSNPTDRLGRVNRNNHYYNDYNKTSRQGFSLLSPLVPEGFYDVFQELLLSEYVWVWEWNYEWDITGSGDIRYVDPYTGILEKRTLPVKTIVSYRKPQANNGVIVRPLYNLTPVNIKTSGLTKKTHSQDKTNIQYQFDFDYAFDDVYLHS